MPSCTAPAFLNSKGDNPAEACQQPWGGGKTIFRPNQKYLLPGTLESQVLKPATTINKPYCFAASLRWCITSFYPEVLNLLCGERRNCTRKRAWLQPLNLYTWNSESCHLHTATNVLTHTSSYPSQGLTTTPLFMAWQGTTSTEPPFWLFSFCQHYASVNFFLGIMSYVQFFPFFLFNKVIKQVRTLFC